MTNTDHRTAAPSSPRREPHDPLEVILKDIWQHVLGAKAVGVSERFSDVGGNAELSERMIERVERACARALPSAARSLDVTVAELARMLKDEPGKPGRGVPKYIGRNLHVAGPGQRRPLFFMHGDFNGGGFYCLALAGHLGKDQPFHAFAPHGIDGAPLPVTIEEMAAERLVDLRRLRPNGPYRIAGHCNGALVAYEMARILVADNEAVERLLLIAPVLLGEELQLSRWTPRRVWGGIWRRARRLSRPRMASSPTAARVANASVRQDPLLDAYSRVMRGYRPGPFDGSLTILWPAEEPSLLREGSARAWRRASPRVRERFVPGAHLTSITTHAAELARSMRACLDGED